MKRRIDSSKEFEKKRKDHEVLIKKLRTLFKTERSLFSKTLIQQNLIFHQLNEVSLMITSVTGHLMIGCMPILNQEDMDQTLSVGLRVKEDATLGEAIALFEKISAQNDGPLIILLKEYNRYRNNLVHKLVLRGKYKSIKQIKEEARKALEIGNKIISQLNARNYQLEVYLHRITYYIVKNLKWDENMKLIINEPVPTMEQIVKELRIE